MFKASLAECHVPAERMDVPTIDILRTNTPDPQAPSVLVVLAR